MSKLKVSIRIEGVSGAGKTLLHNVLKEVLTNFKFSATYHAIKTTDNLSNISIIEIRDYEGDGKIFTEAPLGRNS